MSSEKKPKRTVTVGNRPTPQTLQKLGEAHMSALIVLSRVEGIPEASKPYHTAAMQMLAFTLNDIQNRFARDSKRPLDLSYVEASFTTQETPNVETQV